MELPQVPLSKPRKKRKVLTQRYLLGLLLIACQVIVLYELCVLAGFSYWLIIILFLFAYNLRNYKDLFEWMNGKPVKIFDEVYNRMFDDAYNRNKARKKVLEARKKSFKKWEKDEGNNLPPHLEIFDKDRK